MKPYDSTQFEKTVKIAQANIEEFRYEYARAHYALNRDERRLIQKISAMDVFYERYVEFYLPTLKTLRLKKPFDTIKSSLSKGLVLSATESKHLTEIIYQDRHEKLINDTVAPLSDNSQPHALTLLHIPEEQLTVILYHYRDVTLYQDVSKKVGYLAYDPYDSFLKRSITRWKINRNRKKTLRSEHRRLTQIDRRLHRIDKEKGDLIRRIVSNHLELMPVLSLRNEFIKRVSQNNATSKKQSFEQFEKTIQSLMKKQIDTYAVENPDAIFTDFRSHKQQLEQLLYDTFTLSNSQSNALITDHSQYAKLYSEHEKITARQQARNAFIHRDFDV